MGDQQRSKRGSSRRKGDEFQDLSALLLVLNLYCEGESFEAFLEYEKAEAIDDIVIFNGNTIQAIQAKYSVDPLAVYTPADFTDETSRTCFGRYAAGWSKARAAHPDFDIRVELFSNRSRDSQLEGVITSGGLFAPEFVTGKTRKASTFREKLKQACRFIDDDDERQFREFLGAFRFQLSQRSLNDLRRHIEGEILDHRLGISDRSVFHELKELIERHAIELHEPITYAQLEEIFGKAQQRFLLPQVFPVDSEHFVGIPGFYDSLVESIVAANQGYIVVTGLPGSGKSTSLSESFDRLQQDQRFAVCRYFCFISPDDDVGRLRLEAEALRVNILSELNKQFRHVLDREHDYSERHLAEALSEIGSVLSEEGRKLVILLDGLDHAEREVLVRDSVLRALPSALPPGVIIVVGSQELKSWQPLALQEGRERRHIAIPLFTLDETRQYLTEKYHIFLNDEWVAKIQEKSQGLPLYLRYIAEWLRKHDSDPSTIKTMPEAVEGDIRNYYQRLWASFERDRMGHERYMCGVLAELRFPVHPEELAEFQSEISIVNVHESVRAIAHLLRDEAGLTSIFHDSFRVFVKSKMDSITRLRIAGDILAKLKKERGSSRWFSYAFQYALDAKEDEYLLSEVNRSLVDFALQQCRPAQDIIDAIYCAIKAAIRRSDLVALARLGSLHFRTHERLNSQFDYALLARVQLALGRVGDVLGFCCRPGDRYWLVDDEVATRVMEWCARTGQRDLGERLFNIFLETHTDKEWTSRYEIERLASILGIYSNSPAISLRWLSQIEEMHPETLERPDLFAPGYAPQLKPFLEAFFLYRKAGAWHRLKRVRRLFPNQLVRYYLLRLVARNRSSEELAVELEDYLAHSPVNQNLEIAAYAALAGFTASRVKELAGPFVLPPQEKDNSTRTRDLESQLDAFRWITIVLGAEDDQSSIRRVNADIGRGKTMYSGFLHFLLHAGLCLGRAATGKSSDIYQEAVLAIHKLSDAGTEEEANEMDTLRACRPMLPDIIFDLTRRLVENTPERLEDWSKELLSLRDSEMWTSQWGISETTEDYKFELQIWERLADLPVMRSRLRPILISSAKTFSEATALKAGSRCDHFLWLASIAASCGLRSDAEEWRRIGIGSSLTYGYHKDGTLDVLIDVLELINEHEPQHGLQRTAAILEMAKWMRLATDNRGTQDFEQAVFRIILQTNREAAFALIRYFRNNSGRWKMLDCLEQFCATAQTGDSEVLWTLKDAFTPHFVETGRHPKQVIRTAQILRNLGKKQCPTCAEGWDERYNIFIRTHIDPAWWPDDVWNIVTAKEGRPAYHARDPYSPASVSKGSELEISLAGKSISREEIQQLLEESVDSFCRTVGNLRTEDSYFFDRGMIGSAFRRHVEKAQSVEIVLRLFDLAQNVRDWIGPENFQIIANRLFDFGDSNAGFDSLLLAYRRSCEYGSGTEKAQPYLSALCERDRKRVSDFLAELCGEKLKADYGGYELPLMIARYFYTVGDIDRLRNLFDDYITHCQELFDYLPRDEQFGWLREFGETGRDASEEIVDFIIDLIGEPEIDQAHRLVRVLVDLSKTRPELVCRVVSRRMPDSDPLLRDRLEVLLDALSCLCPTVMSPHLEQFTPMLAEPNFRLRSEIIRIFRHIAEKAHIPEHISSIADKAECEYSNLIPHSSSPFLIFSEPSPEFFKLSQRALLPSLRCQLLGICDLLQIPLEIILSYIERRMRETGWNENEETERLKDDWRGNGRDHRMVWIVPRFQTDFSNLLQNLVHQVVENGSYDATTIHALKNIVRCGDPNFLARLPEVKPADVPTLDIVDGVAWIEQGREPSSLEVEVLSQDGWTTIYEERVLSQTEGSNPKFIANLRVQSVLAQPAATSDSENWPVSEWSDTIPIYHLSENLTLEEASIRLADEAKSIEGFSGEFLPLISVHNNNKAFQGYSTIAFLHPIWVNRYDLSFQGNVLFFKGQCIARMEHWQEGYVDDCYSRDLLSTGVRLIVRNDWLKMVQRDYELAFIIEKKERRKFFEHTWRPEPTSKSDRNTRVVYTS